MNVAKMRHLLVVGGCVLVLFALKAHEGSTPSLPQVSTDVARGAIPTATPSATVAGAGAFDYYVLSLSWSPQYCATEARPNDSQCQRNDAFVVHGLWPQNERGYPGDCRPGEYLQDDLIRRMLPIMPSKPLIIHEWKKHGTCTGLSADRYFDTLQRAYASVRIPPRYQQASDYLSTSSEAIERDFIGANPTITPAMLAVQCNGNYLQELRICMTKDLIPRACSGDVRDRCGHQIVLRPSRGG